MSRTMFMKALHFYLFFLFWFGFFTLKHVGFCWEMSRINSFKLDLTIQLQLFFPRKVEISCHSQKKILHKSLQFSCMNQELEFNEGNPWWKLLPSIFFSFPQMVSRHFGYENSNSLFIITRPLQQLSPWKWRIKDTVLSLKLSLTVDTSHANPQCTQMSFMQVQLTR